MYARELDEEVLGVVGVVEELGSGKVEILEMRTPIDMAVAVVIVAALLLKRVMLGRH